MFTINYTYEYIKTKIQEQRFISVAIPHYNNSNYILTNFQTVPVNYIVPVVFTKMPIIFIN